jgi:hypothetical protein
VPDKRMHRGPHPDDCQLFAPEAWPRLREAVSDLCWLYGRGYASASAIKIVGDRYGLGQRQRIAVGRCACSDDALQRRQLSRIEPAELLGQTLWIDGYNLLTSIEAAMAGGVILAARDGCFRDMASVHGTWRRVRETVPAIEIVGQFLANLGLERAVWHLDSPVSNSGRLKVILQAVAREYGWLWDIELVSNPDKILCQTTQVVATADSGILDNCGRWVNMARAVIEHCIPNANIVPMGTVTTGS